MNIEHNYNLNLAWTGNTGKGTINYVGYERSFVISTENKPDILSSSDVLFRGDFTKYNPEEMFLASIASCHMLWFLHLCANKKIIIQNYSDNPVGIMQ